MSRDNVEVIRKVYAEFMAHREPPWEFFSPDAEFDPSQVLPDVGVLRARDEAASALRGYAETFDEFHIDLEEVVHADESRVITAVRDGGRIRDSDAEIWNRFFHVFTLRGGKVTRWSSHTERERALEAAGLRE